MSGIYGIVGYDGVPVTPEKLAPMAAAMSFWGRDGHGQWCGPGAGLGHLLLRVTPESLYERLPGSIRVAPHLVITADARIDNRDELFNALGVPDTGRGATPDSSLILLAYERWGSDCVKRLLGDFAFAIWDSLERKLFCARDPFGCAPFVYHYGAGRFLFASDVKGVLACLEQPRLNEPLVAAYLQMTTYYAEKRQTFFEEVVKLQPGHSLTLTVNGVQTSRYWSPEDAPGQRFAGDADYAEQLAFLFRQAVECRLRSAFPVGAHLSGGMDSSAIGIVVSRVLRDRGEQLAAFSWSPPPEPAASFHPAGEYARIDAVCRRENISCEYIPVTTASLIAIFQRDFTVEPMEMLAREANVQARAEARQLRVLLSGWGGDDAVTCRTATSPAAFLAPLQWRRFQGAARLRLNTANGNPFLKARRLAGILRDLAVTNLPDSVYALGGNPFQAYSAPCIQPPVADLYREAVKGMRGPALRRLAEARKTILLFLESGHIFMRVEHWAASGARHGLVYRYPMLDKRLVEFALADPPWQSGQTDRRRSLFRNAVSSLLPTSADWDSVKIESATFSALEREHIRAHSEWAQHLASRKASPVAARFVDSARIRTAIERSSRSGRLSDLSGVREAFACYAVRI